MKSYTHIEESRVNRTYQRHSYDTEKHEAWRLLGERPELLMRGDDNIVTRETTPQGDFHAVGVRCHPCPMRSRITIRLSHQGTKGVTR